MRADIYLAENGYAPSRTKAALFIENGWVYINGKPITKPSFEIDIKDLSADSPHIGITVTETEKYVSRGGIKLQSALDTFGIKPEGKICADIGSSSGGFTDCLLQYGAQIVYACDSGTGQMDKRLLSDRRIRLKEGFNARYIRPEDTNGQVDICVMDVSFISQTLIIPVLSGIIAQDGILISLIKPQFEAGKNAVGKNGIVKDAQKREDAVRNVIACAQNYGLYLSGCITSPIKGGDGNIEYLACFGKTDSAQNTSGNLLRELFRRRGE